MQSTIAPAVRQDAATIFNKYDAGTDFDFVGMTVDQAVAMLSQRFMFDQARLSHHYPADQVARATAALLERRAALLARSEAGEGNDPAWDGMDWLAAMEGEDPELDFVLPGLVAGTVGLIGGAGGVSKSFFSLQTCVSIALGRDVFGLWDGAELKQGKAVFVSLEDPEIPLRKRAVAIGRHLAADERKAHASNMRVLPMYGTGKLLMERDRDTGRVIPNKETDNLKRVADGARLIVIDTLNRVANAAGLQENEACDMGGLVGIIEQVCQSTGAAAIMLHHLNKGGTFADDSETLEQGAMRGSSVIVDNSRWVMLMATMNEKQSKRRYGDEWEAHHRRWVKRMLVKQNHGALIADQWALRGDGGVLLGYEQPQDRPEGAVNLVKAPKAAKCAPAVKPTNGYTEF